MCKRKNKNNRKAVALLVVLLIVMAVTILSLGFLSKSDVELACGKNMVLRTQMDHLAESALEHARGLILNPQDLAAEDWAGGAGLQLSAGGNDYYDVTVQRDGPASGPTYRCNYDISCQAYRLAGGEKVGRSGLVARLRLDPCITLWSGANTSLWNTVTINGDVYCNGNLSNTGRIRGDVFASGDIAGINIDGRTNKFVTQSPVPWPRVTAGDFTSHYPVVIVGPNNISGQSFGPYNPVRLCYSNGNLKLDGNVQINSMLIVNGNLIVQSGTNTITAPKNLPAVLVMGNLIVQNLARLDAEGLVVVNGQFVSGPAGSQVNITGVLFAGGAINGGNGSVTVTAAPARTAVLVWSATAQLEKWGQAGGAFFRSIKRQ